MLETSSTPTPQTNEEKVKQTAKDRANYSRDFIKQSSLTMIDFINTVKQAPFNILGVNPDNDASLVNCIYKCQKTMDLPDQDDCLGCDAKFGAYTLERFNTTTQSHSRLASLESDIRSPMSTPTKDDPAQLSPESLVTNPTELIVRNELDRHYEYNEMYTVGDSLMLNASKHVASKRGEGRSWFIAKKYAKGARRLVDHNNSWDSNEEKAMIALDQSDCKLLVLNGGYNDLNNTTRTVMNMNPTKQKALINKSIDQIIASYKKIIKKAHSYKPSKEVVLFTIPLRRWGSAKWMNKQSKAIIKDAITRTNERIYSEVPADMIVDVRNLSDEQAFGGKGKGDGLHWKQAAADFIMTSVYDAK